MPPTTATTAPSPVSSTLTLVLIAVLAAVVVYLFRRLLAIERHVRAVSARPQVGPDEVSSAVRYYLDAGHQPHPPWSDPYAYINAPLPHHSGYEGEEEEHADDTRHEEEGDTSPENEEGEESQPDVKGHEEPGISDSTINQEGELDSPPSNSSSTSNVECADGICVLKKPAIQ